MHKLFVVDQPRPSILSLSHTEGVERGLLGCFFGGLGGVEVGRVRDWWAIIVGVLELTKYDELITINMSLLTP